MNSNDYIKMRKRQHEIAVKKHILDPFDESGEWRAASTKEMYKMYKKVRARVNQQFREYEKRGIEELSPQYQKLAEQSGRRTKEGNVGYNLALTKKEFESMDERQIRSILTEEYKAVFTSYTSKVYEVKDLEKYVSDNLSHIKIDMDLTKMTAEEKAKYKKELSNYWKLYHEVEDQHLLSDFNLKSDVVQDIVEEYVDKYGNPLQGRTAMVLSTREKFKNIQRKYKDDPKMDEKIWDEIVQEESTSEDVLDSLNKASDRLLYMLVKKGYAEVAPEIRRIPNEKRPKRSRMKKTN